MYENPLDKIFKQTQGLDGVVKEDVTHLYEQSVESLIPLFTSLTKFQDDIGVLPKTKSVQKGKYHYLPLNQMIPLVNPYLRKQGLGFTQTLNGTGVTTILFHYSSGAFIKGMAEIPQGVEFLAKGGYKTMNDFQSAGNGITYFRRYSLETILGLTTDEDVDANDFDMDISQSVTVGVIKESNTNKNRRPTSKKVTKKKSSRKGSGNPTPFPEFH